MALLPRALKSARIVAKPEPAASTTAMDFPSADKQGKSKTEAAVFPPLPLAVEMLNQAGQDPKRAMQVNAKRVH